MAIDAPEQVARAGTCHLPPNLPLLSSGSNPCPTPHYPDPSNDTANDFIIIIDDTSPTLSYSPSSVPLEGGSFITGWQSTTAAALPLPDGGQGDIATSLHITASDGASVTVHWNGTGITLFGELTPTTDLSSSSATYSVSLDGTPTTNYASFFSSPSDYTNNVLASFANLSYAEHTIELVMHNPDNILDGSVLLQFDRAALTSVIPPRTSSSNSQGATPATRQFSDSDDLISYRGQWSFVRNLLPGTNYTFHVSENAGDRAVLSFNGTAISLSGLVSPSTGTYNISLDNEDPISILGESPYLSAPTVLYYRTGLDPSVMHKLGIANAGSPGGGVDSFFALNSVNVTTVEQLSGTPPMSGSSSRLSGGKIAAVAICSSIACLGLIVFIAWMVRRRRASRRKQELLVNPRLSRFRRFSFVARSIRSADGEKQPEIEEVPVKAAERNEGVLDIRASKDLEEEYIDDIEAARALRTGHATRHASQNSDGSFSIDLPELPIPPRGYIHVRTSSSSFSVPSPRPPRTPPKSPPPTKPRGPRDMRTSYPSHTRDSSRGILLSEFYNAVSEDGVIGNVPASERTQPHQSRRVSFRDEPYATTQQRREERHASVGTVSSPISPKFALAFGQIPNIVTAVPDVPVILSPPDTPITPITFAVSPVSTTVPSQETSIAPGPDPHLSFLDFDSSASTSLRSDARSNGQSRSNSTRSSSKSGSGVTTEYESLPSDRRMSMGLSIAIGGGPTSSRPSLSPNISLHPVTLPPTTIPEPRSAIPEDATFPLEDDRQTEPSEMLPSPTESMAHTAISEIRFRDSSYSTLSDAIGNASRRTSRRISGSQLPPHPPLPAQQDRPLLVQRILGMTASSGPSTPFRSVFDAPGPSSSSGERTSTSAPQNPVGEQTARGRGSSYPKFPSSPGYSLFSRPR
ncbi:hypothetical protein K474DRAFT_1699576 [Panus rudis PR-1116 ss-1]|nr:hypothetical protein K474DRAFT_1699576 [Panus rudis PR-1116 ss-1]